VALATWWKDLGTITDFTPQVKQTIINRVLSEANGRSIEELAQERDEMIVELLATRSKMERITRWVGKPLQRSSLE
jgi:carnitine 3-dehydrogenase